LTRKISELDSRKENKMSNFSNFDTKHCILIIMNDWELYRIRKSFGNCDDFANFYRYKKDISTFVDIEQVN
jgi:hypothetical protein